MHRAFHHHSTVHLSNWRCLVATPSHGSEQKLCDLFMMAVCGSLEPCHNMQCMYIVCTKMLYSFPFFLFNFSPSWMEEEHAMNHFTEVLQITRRNVSAWNSCIWVDNKLLFVLKYLFWICQLIKFLPTLLIKYRMWEICNNRFISNLLFHTYKSLFYIQF